jgi:hypothetical protein
VHAEVERVGRRVLEVGVAAVVAVGEPDVGAEAAVGVPQQVDALDVRLTAVEDLVERGNGRPRSGDGS